ncbi:MAG: hypothetical protein JW779_15530 [Candidatus Thorarchaeota archaeon]|nr:hypothetical protein [Candidatus Thorarchaeota archaeon]
MNVVYKKWEPGQGLEEVQAKIYTEVSGLPARAEQIGPRNDNRGKEATRYALTEDGKPLAYITSDIIDNVPGSALIGYPWSMNVCPTEVKNKLFNDLLDHLYSLDGINRIITAVVVGSKTKNEQIQFFKERGFIETERNYRYNLDMDVKETAKMKLDDDTETLTARAATEEDLHALVEIALIDNRLRYAFPNEEGFTAYFRDRVLKDGHCILLFDSDKPVAATAALRFRPDGSILRGEEDRIIMRFTAFHPGYEFAWDRLVVELAKECNASGMSDIPLRVSFGYESQDPTAMGVAKMQSNIELYEIFYVHQKESK